MGEVTLWAIAPPVQNVARDVRFDVRTWKEARLSAISAFDIRLEVVEDRLPTGTLHLGRVLILGFKYLGDGRYPFRLDEGDPHLSIIAQTDFDASLRINCYVLPLKIETERAVLGGHGVVETPARAQVVGRFGAMPCIGREIPVDNMFRVGPMLPHGG